MSCKAQLMKVSYYCRRRLDPWQDRIGNKMKWTRTRRTKASNDWEEAVQLWRGLGKYLTAGMELGSPQIVFPARGREYEAVNVRITVNNTAPTDPGLPRVVFIGVGLQANQSGLKGRLRKQMVPKALSAPPQGRSRIHAVTDGEDAAQITSSERRLGDVLLPGQSVVYEVDVPAKDVPYRS